MGSRYFENPFTDSLELNTWDFSRNQLSLNFSKELSQIQRQLFTILEDKLPAIPKTSDSSIYAGTAGLAYLYWFLYEKESDPSIKQALLEKGNALVERSLKKIRNREVTFLCGDTGPLCIAAATKQRMGQVDECKRCVSDILNLSPAVTDVGRASDIPNELLYGRVGYLYSLLFLQKHVTSVAPQIIKEVAASVINAGRRSGSPPLMWHWHGKEYLGAAHGVAGILYLLLQVKEYLTDEHLLLIKNTLDYLLTISFKSGNLPSSIGSNDDRLVHWCHGAPGFVQLLLAAAHIWKEKRYLVAAMQCGEVVWTRGLLKKGYGLCHGVAGNAYTFLALYQATRQVVHLDRAVQMGRWCKTFPENQEAPPDRPYSLFEGLAGTVFFLKDLQDPLEAVFPGYSISPLAIVSI